MGWNSSATAFDTAKNASKTLLFCHSGVIVRQVETETVSERRGLTESAAAALAGVTDSTSSTTYYRSIGGTDHSITVLSGTRTTTTAQRANEADGWRTVTRSVTYSAEGLSGWSTSLTSDSASAVEISYDKSVSHVCTMGGSTALYSVKSVSVTEYRHLTQSAATALVNYNTGDNVVQKTIWFKYLLDSTWMSGAGRAVLKGTEMHASSRRGSAADGYTVTVTTTVHSWSQSGQTSSQKWEEAS